MTSTSKNFSEITLGTQIIDIDDFNTFSSNIIGDFGDCPYELAYIENEYVELNGLTKPYNGWKRTDYIEIDKNLFARVETRQNQWSAHYNCFFDKDKNFISQFTLPQKNDGEISISIPENAKYFILSMPNDLSCFAVSKNGNIRSYTDKILTLSEDNEQSIARLDSDVTDLKHYRLNKKGFEWKLSKQTSNLNGFNRYISYPVCMDENTLLGADIPSNLHFYAVCFNSKDIALQEYEKVGDWSFNKPFNVIQEYDLGRDWNNSGEYLIDKSCWCIVICAPLDNTSVTPQIQKLFQKGMSYYHKVDVDLKVVEDKVAVMDEQVQSVLAETDEANIIHLNKDIDYIVQGASAKMKVQGKTKNDFLTLIHASDLHGDDKRAKRIVEYLNHPSYDNIKGAIFTGDFNESSYGNQGFEKTFANLFDKTEKYMLPVLGNHDIGFEKNKYASPNQNTIENITARYITPYMNQPNVVQAEKDGNKCSYYYVDFPDYKIRIFCLDEFEMPRIDSPTETNKYKYSLWYRYISQNQADWLCETLKNTPDGYSIVIAIHQMTDQCNLVETKFFGKENINASCYVVAQPTILQDIVDAYISRQNLQKTITASISNVALPTDEVPEVNLNCDFTQAKGEFICYLLGHTHCDLIGRSVYATNKQLNVAMTTSSIYSAYDDLFRLEGTKSEDCFNVITFDTVEKQIRLIRVGANVTSDLQKRDFVSVSYKQNE